MSNSSLVVYKKLSPNCTKPRNSKIDTIVIHHMAGNLSIETCGKVFASSSRRASSNYGIGTDGRVGMYVIEANRSWATSSPEVDHRAVTIEVANSKTGGDWPVSDKAMTSLIDLCVDICKRNGIKKLNYTGDKSGNLLMHCWYAATACPGPYLKSKFSYIADEVNKKLTDTPSKPASYSLSSFIGDVQKACGANVDKIAGPETLSKTPTVSATKNRTHAVVKPIQKRLYALGYTEVGTADGIAGPNFTKAVKRFQKEHACVSDGEVTAKNTTWKKLLGMSVSEQPKPKPSTYSLADFIGDVQKACGAKVDRIAGPETLSKTVTVSSTKNRSHKVVKPIQKRLYALGYTEVGTADGIAGPNFTKAVKRFQKEHACVSDGEVTARFGTWKRLLGF